MQLTNTRQLLPVTVQQDNVVSLPERTALKQGIASESSQMATASTHAGSLMESKAFAKPLHLKDQTTMIAHEMRSPLCVILNVLRDCKAFKLDTLGQTRMSLAFEEAERLNRMVNDMLAYARSHEPALQWTEIKLVDLLSEVMYLVAELPSAADHSIIMPSKLPNVIIRGNVDGLKQVFLNLLTNACEAVCAGDTITIHCHLEPHTHQISIQIHNGGQPIPTELLPLLGYQPVTTKPSGHGLGLLMVRKIIQAHAGNLTITSSAFRGTTMSVCLPVTHVEHRQSPHNASQTITYAPLSERELEVLQLIVEGSSNAAIAQTLFIAPDMVKAHISSLMNKLGANDRTQAAIKALRIGLVQ